jgi:hypothetical protein
MKKSPELPLLHSVFWIVASTFIISGVSHKLLHMYFGEKRIKEQPTLHPLSYIVQTGLQKEALHSDYLSELLGLSKDVPTLFTQFDEGTAEKKLLTSPLFSGVKVKKIPPNMVYVDYTVRKPIGWAADFVNTVVDKDGYLFPMTPFFSPKKLPEIYLSVEGIQGASFESPIQGKLFELALQVLNLFDGCEKEAFRVKRVDVSQSFFPTLGKRGIVVILENDLGEDLTSTHFLRLSTQHFSQEITNYQTLRSRLLETEKEKALLGERIKEKIIDLRLSQLAFVD